MCLGRAQLARTTKSYRLHNYDYRAEPSADRKERRMQRGSALMDINTYQMEPHCTARTLARRGVLVRNREISMIDRSAIITYRTWRLSTATLEECLRSTAMIQVIRLLQRHPLADFENFLLMVNQA